MWYAVSSEAILPFPGAEALKLFTSMNKRKKSIHACFSILMGIVLTFIVIYSAEAQDNLLPKPVKRGTSQGLAEARLNYTPGQAPEFWSVATAETVMARYPDYREAYWKPWSYVQGYMFCAFERLYQATGDRMYLDFMKAYIDNFVNEDGMFSGDKLTNLDNLMTGVTIIALYEHTKEEKYRKAAEQFRRAFDNYPRSDGQFWHGSSSPNMWIDGVFMGQMFLIRYGHSIGDTEYCYNEASKQIITCAKHLKKEDSGLYLHAWTEKPENTVWADPITGLSPEVWSEGLGWYALVVPELLAVLSKSNPYYEQIRDIYLRMCQGLKQTQDPKSGGWFLIVDKGERVGNYIDPSGTAMFVYSIQKGMDTGLLRKKEYKTVVANGYKALLEHVKVNEKGLVDVIGSADGITIKKDFDTYIKVPKLINAKEAVAGFLWASTIMETRQLKRINK